MAQSIQGSNRRQQRLHEHIDLDTERVSPHTLSASIPPRGVHPLNQHSSYDEPTYLGDYTISTPNDCDGTNPYLTYKLFTQGPYDVTLCSAACASLSAANRVYAAQNPSLYNGTHAVETCQFFTSYVLYKNGKGLGQYCAMYSRTFEGTKLAVNRGYEYGADRYTIGYSYSYANITDAGSAPTC